LGKKIYIAFGTSTSLQNNLWFAFSTAKIHKKFLDHKKGLAWCLEMIKKDLNLEKTEK
jgi:hypothetical protein